MTETTRPTSVRVIADHTPGPHRTDSDDLCWWLPVLGPTASVLAYRFARHAAHVETCWPTEDLARMVGLAGNRSRLWLSLERLHRFHVTTFVSTDTQLAGHRVVGAAPSARAAIELSAGAGIPARTLHSLLGQWRSGYDAPQPGSLLVVDEAGMADVRTLEAVVTRQVAAGGRVLLAGDHHQLPEVGAGGGFAAATVQAGCVAELDVNRRQRQP